MLLKELKPNIQAPQKVESYLTPDWDRLVKSCKSQTSEIPKTALESDETFISWARSLKR